jgi:hypothetical protein
MWPFKPSSVPPVEPAQESAQPAPIASTTSYNLGLDAPSFAVGLDLGQATDYSALAVVEHVHVLPPGLSLQGFAWELEKRSRDAWELGYDRPLPAAIPELHVRHLQRWELGTPYHVIVDDVCRLLGEGGPLWGARLFFDRSGVGRAVGDLLWSAYVAGRLGVGPLGKTMTGGLNPGAATVPKLNLMTALQLPIQQGRFRIAQGVPLGDVLERELTGFKMRLSQSGGQSFDIARRDGEGHGDLVIACALAVINPEFGVRPRVAEFVEVSRS